MFPNKSTLLASSQWIVEKCIKLSAASTNTEILVFRDVRALTPSPSPKNLFSTKCEESEEGPVHHKKSFTAKTTLT